MFCKFFKTYSNIFNVSFSSNLYLSAHNLPTITGKYKSKAKSTQLLLAYSAFKTFNMQILMLLPNFLIFFCGFSFSVDINVLKNSHTYTQKHWQRRHRRLRSAVCGLR